MSQLEVAVVPRVRLAIAISLGAISIAGSLLLVASDGLDASVKWAHHAGMSAAPLLLVAGAIAAVSIARPPTGRGAVMRLVGIVAFVTWGLAQLFPDSSVAGGLGDAAILLFVVEAGCLVISDSRGHLRTGRSALPADPGPDHPDPDWLARRPLASSPTTAVAVQPCCVSSAEDCACAGSRST